MFVEIFGDSIVNYGSITIDGTRDYGINNAMKFINHENATVEILNISAFGFFQTTDMNNHGSILIDQCNGDGLSTSSNGSILTNHSVGTIEIKNCTGDPLNIPENITFLSPGILDVQ